MEGVDKRASTAARNSSKTKHERAVCRETFRWRADLHIHMDLHLTAEPYSCSDCTFTEESEGKSNKTIKCGVCNKCFSLMGSLGLHMLLHTGERPYSCPVCKRGFIQKVHLSSHFAVHTGVRPFSCPECHSRFVMTPSLIQHMKGRSLSADRSVKKKVSC